MPCFSLSEEMFLMGKIAKLLKLLSRKRFLFALLKFQAAAAVEHQRLVRSIGFEILIDVGANVGQFSLLVREQKPDARIFAFEPLSRAADTYRKVFTGDESVILHQVAIGPNRADAEMHVSKRADSSSLLPISAIQADQFPGTEEVGRENVKVAPLIDFVAKDQLAAPALLKIDVQGSELDVLSSSRPLLPHIDWIYVEASFIPFYEGQALAHDVVAFLLEINFRLSGIYNPVYDKAGSVVQADFLFARAE